MKPTTVHDLIAQVRSQVDEVNNSSLDTIDDILPALNRGQNKAAEILARHYAEPLIRPITVATVSGTAAYAIPEDAMGDRVTHVEMLVSGLPTEIKMVTYTQLGAYKSSGTVSIPSVCTVYDRSVVFAPSPSGAYSAQIWYVKQPQPLNSVWGRITNIPTSTSLIVDSIGSEDDDTTPSTDMATLDCFFNVVDAQTGAVKGTYQALTIEGNEISIKSTSPSLATLWGSTVELSLTAPSTLLVPEVNDYICPAGGSCVPMLKHPFADFIVQFAVAAAKRKLGDNSGLEDALAKEFENDVKTTWAGRAQAQRVINRSPYLNFPRRTR